MQELQVYAAGEVYGWLLPQAYGYQAFYKYVRNWRQKGDADTGRPLEVTWLER